ncbi:hypothetical protein I7I51_05571, partial [Histoplasma capsulatum]
MASYYENHPYNTQHRRAQTADFYEPSYTTSRPSNSRWGGPTDLVRPDEPEDSHVEEIQRDFPPGSCTSSHRTDHGRSGGGAIYAKRRTAHDPSVRRTHSAGGRGRDRHGDYYAPDEGYQRSRTHGYGNRLLCHPLEVAISYDLRARKLIERIGDHDRYRLATNRVVNGPRSRSRSRGRARSEGRGAKELASAGLLAAVGKSAYDHFVSKSRTRERRSANDSDDDSSPDRSRRSRGSKKRSQSVSEYLSKGLAALGLEEGKQSSSHGNRRRGRQRYDDDSDSDIGYSDKYRSRRRRSHSRDSYSRDVGSHPASSSFSSLRDRGAVIPLCVNNGNDTDSESSCLSTDEEKRTHRKLRRREIVTTGFPTLATVHASHAIVKSLKKREERKAQFRQGEIISDEARRQRTKNNLKDVASIAVAAIGSKSAVDERRDAAHHRAECNSFKARCRKERKEGRSTKEEREARSLNADDRDHRLSKNSNNSNSPSLASVKDAPR